MTPRPWRLTRRQRVEMEAALSDLRRLLRPRQQIATVVRAAWIAGAIYYAWPDDLGSDPRTLRASVAIALRAALRADEDARCEEALARALARYPDAYDDADTLREWPAMLGPTRDTGARTSLADRARSMGMAVERLCTPDERERWERRDLPVMAVAYALWERTR